MRVAARWRETCEQLAETVKYYWLGGRRVAMRKVPEGQPETLYYLFSDHLGSTSVAYDTDSGAWVMQRYYPWGTIRPGGGNVLPTDYTFTGQRWDESIGLMDYKARWYDPALGRFVQPDTIVPDPANPQDLNRYSYVRNNPLRYTDPTGHYILLEEDFGVRITAEGVIQIVLGGSRFPNPVEVALANAILSDDPRHLEAIPPDIPAWAIERSLAHVLAELGYLGGGPGATDLLLDPTLAFGLAFGMVKAIEGGDAFPAEGLPAGERLAYTETARDAAVRRWRPGDPINAPTRYGYPSWSTVRRRWRINEALNNPGDWSEENLARMRRNLAPVHPKTGERLHLHHISGRGGPDPHNPANILPLWEREHYRMHYGGR
jgi:RHS repeat-associated protein